MLMYVGVWPRTAPLDCVDRKHAPRRVRTDGRSAHGHREDHQRREVRALRGGGRHRAERIQQLGGVSAEQAQGRDDRDGAQRRLGGPDAVEVPGSHERHDRHPFSPHDCYEVSQSLNV